VFYQYSPVNILMASYGKEDFAHYPQSQDYYRLCCKYNISNLYDRVICKAQQTTKCLWQKPQR